MPPLGSERQVWSVILASVFLLAACVILVITPVRAAPESLPGAGPVLLEALRSGWEPPASPPRPAAAESRGR